MLAPQSNPFRQQVDLSGFWDLRFDPDREGRRSGWPAGVPGGRPAAVPASWNDQFEDGRDYLGDTWYQTRFDLPWGWGAGGQRLCLRFGSANYLAEAWLNGVRLGEHEGGHLPFEFDVTPHVRPEGNRLVVCVEGELKPDRVPPGNVPSRGTDSFGQGNFPPGSFDFFPFCGLHRPVLLTAAPSEGLADVTVTTELTQGGGRVKVSLALAGGERARARVSVRGPGAEAAAEADVSGGAVETVLEMPGARPWSPHTPVLYDLEIALSRAGAVFDRYTLPIGLRTVRVEGDRLLLNGEPIALRGFGRHEDFPVAGRGLVPAVAVKDLALMKWIGANSFRTTHYPYAEATMDLADRLGFLVIDETPAVGLFFADEAGTGQESSLERRLRLCRQYVQDLIARDKNHPSVILWSLANEPHSGRPEAVPFFRELYDLARSLDPTRPITIASYRGLQEESFEFLDLVCLNRYYGWYTQSGQLESALGLLSEELDALHARFQKPILLSEFGADTLPGHHAQPPEMFSEEFQAEMLLAYIRLLRSKPYVIGEHIWNLCDFKTGQAVMRVGGLNLKGVFTRDRRPKLAAHRVRDLWHTEAHA